MRDEKGRFTVAKIAEKIAEKEEHVFNIPHVDANVIVIIEKNGQRKPAVSDEVVTRLEIQLPVNPKDTYSLHPSIRFCRRVKILDSILEFNWGCRSRCPSKGTCRYKATSIYSTTWKKGFDEARKLAFEEVQRLLDACEARHQALTNA